MKRRQAYLTLNLLPGIGPGKLRLLLQFFKGPEEILTASRDKLLQVPGIGYKLSEIIYNWRNYCNPEQEIHLAKAAGVYLITPEDEAYPAILQSIHDPPICLYVRGNLEALKNCKKAIAMVGSRQTSMYGVKMAKSLAQAAVAAGWTVVSGLARGIDTAAHQAVLDAQGCTIAVIGSGLNRLYPQENLLLAEEICCNGGAVISEFYMNHLPDKRNFPMRNRIISGLSRGTIVVEAGLKSGSLITAAQALEQNRSVFAVPGKADTPFARGCHSLLRDGAKLVETFQDVIEEFSLLPGLQSKELDRKNLEKERKTVKLSDLEYFIWQEIGEERIGIDDLLVKCEEGPAKIMGTLLMMEIKQVIRQLPGKQLERNKERLVIRD